MLIFVGGEKRKVVARRNELYRRTVDRDEIGAKLGHCHDWKFPPVPAGDNNRVEDLGDILRRLAQERNQAARLGVFSFVQKRIPQAFSRRSAGSARNGGRAR